MPDKFTVMTSELHAYAVGHSAHRDELMRRLSEETEQVAGEMAIMQTAPEQAALMTVLVRAIGARKALEIGTFTGYGAIAIARGLPADGRLLTLDVSEEWTAVASRYIADAGLADRVEIRLGPALESLRNIAEEGSFDFAFVDADKAEYPEYYEECLRLLRPGGLLMLDNVFRGGQIVDADAAEDDRLRATREVNDRAAGDERVIAAMVGVADGVTAVVKL
ncbi:MAG: O-methyltransferase [Solirubrobacterales bacterium]